MEKFILGLVVVGVLIKGGEMKKGWYVVLFSFSDLRFIFELIDLLSLIGLMLIFWVINFVVLISFVRIMWGKVSFIVIVIIMGFIIIIIIILIR